MVPNPSSRAPPAFDNRKLDREAYGLIVDWLELDDNFRKLHGSGSRTEVGARHPNKKTVFRCMLFELQERGFPACVTTGEVLKKHFQRYEAKYKEALTLKMSTGAGLTEAELNVGMTFEDKLEKVCPHFNRLHELYGERHNVRPPATGILGVPGAAVLETTDEEDDEAGQPTHADESTVEGEVQAEDSATHETEPDVAWHDVPLPETPNLPRGPAPTTPPSSGPPGVSTTAGRGTGSPDIARTPDHVPASDPGGGIDRRPSRRKSSTLPPTKSSLADIYSDKQGQANSIRLKLLEAKQKWKSEDIAAKERMQASDLADRKETREVAASALLTREQAQIDREKAMATDAVKREAAQRDHDLAIIKEKENSASQHEEKRMKLFHEQQMEYLKQSQNYLVLTEFLRSTKTQEQLQCVIDMLPKPT